MTAMSARDSTSVHRRQFVVGPRPVMAECGWRHVGLSDGLHLSHCPSLPRASARDRDGVTWHLLGLAAQTARDRSDPLEDLTRSRTADVGDRYHAWAGRWALVGNGELHMDASGLLGCFYSAPEATGARQQASVSTLADAVSWPGGGHDRTQVAAAIGRPCTRSSIAGAIASSGST